MVPAEGAPWTCLCLENSFGHLGLAAMQTEVSSVQNKRATPHGLHMTAINSCCVTLGNTLPSLCLI